MAINTGSRYENSVVDYFRKKEGGITLPVVLYSFDSLDAVSFFYHIYRTGETLQGLSQVYFRTPALWWAIAEYNPEVVDLVHIPDGTVLRIPSV
jgi:hypothetical protein